MAWYDEAVFYHIYPLGLTGAPMHNDYGAPQRLSPKHFPGKTGGEKVPGSVEGTGLFWMPEEGDGRPFLHRYPGNSRLFNGPG